MSIIRNEDIIKYINYLIILCIMFNMIYFSYIVHSSYVRADMWRYIDMYLIPIYNNDFDWKSLWMDHHSQPLTALTFIVNSLYFDLKTNLFFYIGLVSKISISIFLLFYINKYIKDNILKFFFSIVVLSFYLSLNSPIEYSWPLVFRANLWYFMFLMILYNLDNILLYNKTKLNFYMFFSLIFILIFINKSFGYIVNGSLILTLLLVSYYNKDYKSYIKCIILILFSMLTLKIFFLLFGIEPYTEHLNFNFKIFSVINFINSLSVALLSGIVKISLLKQFFDTNMIIIIGYCFSLLYIFTMYIYIKKGIIKYSVLPITLMFFSLLFIVAVLLYRFFPTENHIVNWAVTAPRYTKAYETSIVGMLLSWALMLHYAKIRIGKIFLYILAIFILINSFYYIYKAWKEAPYIVRANLKAETLIRNYKDINSTKPPYFAIGGSFSLNKVNFLRKHNLNIFNQGYK